ncbi:MAG: tRNA 2-selenouridine(34) synthase MnmH [Pseudomonadota bacterium]
MPRTFASLSDVIQHSFDTVIDVRSPAEFAEDHVPGAINLPALSNVQRAEIGTIYVQDSPFRARKLGAAMVARNVAAHLEGPLADKPGGWQPLVYCWRGGQRSGSFASILQQIGWRAETISGGYQCYRKLVVQMLYDAPLPHQRIILLDGNTGTGKTEVLAELAALGVQTIDLEQLAHHRGSLLGEMDRAQPSQKGFESTLAFALDAMDPAQPVVIEAESSKIGRLNIPKSLWLAMIAAPRIMLRADEMTRATYLAGTYCGLAADRDTMQDRLTPLRRIRGHAAVDSWEALLAEKDLTGFAHAMIAEHYDPAYAKSRGAQTFTLLGEISVVSLDEAGIASAACAIVDLINRAS